MTDNYYYKYQKYKNRYLMLKEQLGGTKKSTYVIENIIKQLNGVYSQDKQRINNMPSKDKMGHGAIFLGTDGKNNDIKILLSVQYRYKRPPASTTQEICGFGGNSDPNETVLQTVVRETIEEIFNIKPDKKIIELLVIYINHLQADTYFIYESSPDSYTYIFDVSILGNFIDILANNGKSIIELPTGSGKNLEITQFKDKRKYLDYASVSPSKYGTEKESDFSIYLDKFMEQRLINEPKFVSGLNEVKSLSFMPLKDIYNKNYGTLMGIKPNHYFETLMGKIKTLIPL